MPKKVYTVVPVVMVVYKTQDSWRGFCVPYDVTCDAPTKEEAKRRLELLVRLYEEGLSKYKNPRHLVMKELSDEDDRAFFKKVWPHISKSIENRLKTYKNYVEEELNHDSERRVSVKNITGNGSNPHIELYKRTLKYA